MMKEVQAKYAEKAGLFTYGKQNNKPHMIKCCQSSQKNEGGS